MPKPNKSDCRKDGECSCHSHPPCDFCVSLSETEVDVFANGGLDALSAFWDKLEADISETLKE